ncbi:MAG: effector-associated constant component EACC1 [Pseudonocardiaceae bacterium]
MAESDSGLRAVPVVLEPEPDTDPDEAERSVRCLRAELTELDVESIPWVTSGAAPELTKGIDPATLAALLITLSDPSGTLTRLIETARDWLARNAAAHRLSVTINGRTIVLENASAQERSALIDAYIRRHEVG